MDHFPTVDRTSSGITQGATPPPPVPESIHAAVPRSLPADDAGKTLAEVAQRDLEAALQLLAERARYITGASGAAIALFEKEEMICRASAGRSAPELGAEVQVKTGLTGESVRTRQVLRCDDAETDPRVNRESCRALGIKSVMVVPLIRDQEVVGVFELLADRAHAFEERDVTALERLAEMVQIGMEHAEAATRPLPEVSKASAVPASEPKQLENTPEVLDKGGSPANGEKAIVQTELKAKPPEPVRPQEVASIGKCDACGFPVSGGRTLCLDCETARHAGEQRAPLASTEVPAFLSQLGNPREKSWLASHIYTIGTVLVAVLTAVILVLHFR